MRAEMKKTGDGIEKRLQMMVDKSRQTRAFLARIIYPMYQKAQAERWMTEGVSESDAWKPLSTKPFFAYWEQGGLRKYYDGGYVEYKRAKYSSFDGAGNVMLVATNRLRKSVTGPSKDHRMMVDDHSISVFTTVPYARYVDEKRSFTHFGLETRRKMIRAVRDYVLKRGF